MADFPYLRSRSGHLREAGGRLMNAVIGWQTIALEHDAGRQGVDDVRSRLGMVLSNLDPADLRRCPARLREACAGALLALKAVPDEDAGTYILTDATRDVVLCLEAIAVSVALIFAPAGAQARVLAADFTIGSVLMTVGGPRLLDLPGQGAA